MIVKIEFYPEAEDAMDADASIPNKRAWCKDFKEAEAFIGMLERHV